MIFLFFGLVGYFWENVFSFSFNISLERLMVYIEYWVVFLEYFEISVVKKNGNKIKLNKLNNICNVYLKNKRVRYLF